MDSRLQELLCPKPHQTCQLSSYKEIRKRVKSSKKATSSSFRTFCEVTRILQLVVQIPHHLFVTVQHFQIPNQWYLDLKKPSRFFVLLQYQRHAGIHWCLPIIRRCWDTAGRKECSFNTFGLQVWVFSNHILLSNTHSAHPQFFNTF